MIVKTIWIKIYVIMKNYKIKFNENIIYYIITLPF